MIRELFSRIMRASDDVDVTEPAVDAADAEPSHVDDLPVDPPEFTRFPARMKNGTARRGNAAVPK